MIIGYAPASAATSGAASVDFAAVRDEAIAAEAAGIDFLLLSADATFEPTLLASALAADVDRIGLVAQAASSAQAPYNLARRFASLDTLSGGRGGWLADLDGADPGRDDAYIAIVRGLWDSWEDDAFVYDKAAGRFFIPEKMHLLQHQGAHFSVRGPLNVNRSPQGRPVILRSVAATPALRDIAHADVLMIEAATSAGAAELIRSIRSLAPDAARPRLLVNILTGGDAAGLHAHGIAMTGDTRSLLADITSLVTDLGADGIVALASTGSSGARFLSEVAPGLAMQPAGGEGEPTLRTRLGLARPTHPARTAEAL